MKFNQITYFLRSCETLNFTRASELCHVSQPALSAAIHSLEEDLGGALFERHARSITLTPLGESMRVHLGRVEQARKAAKLAAITFNEPEVSTINLGLMCTLSPNRLLSAMGLFGQIARKTELLVHDIWQSKALELIGSGALDCIIMAHTSALPDRFEQQHLADEPMVLAMHPSHPLAQRGSIRLDDLNLVSYVDRLRCEFRDDFFEEIRGREIKLQVVLRSEREDLVSQSVSNGIGITTMPKHAAEYAGLHTCSLDDMPLVRCVSIVTVKDRELHPVVYQFIDQVVAAYKNA